MEGRMLKPAELCDALIGVGCGKAKLTKWQVTILGIMAGIFIALGGASPTVASHSVTNPGLSKFITGAIFPVGLMLVTMRGAELFTGNCLMVAAVVDKKITFKDLLKNWVIVYATNFIGAILIAFLVFQSGMLNFNSGKVGATVIKVASAKGNLQFWTAFTSGILCNLLVCLAIWGVAAAKDVTGKIAMAWFPIMAFVVCGFEHCVANMYFLTIGILAKSNPAFVQASGVSADNMINIFGFVNNLIPATLGNIVGAVFLAGCYYIVYKYIPRLAQEHSDTNKVVNL